VAWEIVKVSLSMLVLDKAVTNPSPYLILILLTLLKVSELPPPSNLRSRYIILV